MARSRTRTPEFRRLGRWLTKAREQQGLSQQELAQRSGIAQPRLSRLERGSALPTLPQLAELARALAVPLQWFLNGSKVPGSNLADLAIELQSLGIVDLVVRSATVPGAFRPTEEVIALAVSGNQPEPRIIEALPAVLAWNSWGSALLRAYSRSSDKRAPTRVAWLADMALTIERTYGFPGGCPRRRALETIVRWWSKHPTQLAAIDDLGHPAARPDLLPPVFKRWKINYDATLDAFVERAEHLRSLRGLGAP